MYQVLLSLMFRVPPERIHHIAFTAMKLVERELGPHHVSCDIGCHLFSILPPFNIGATTMGYGLGPASASAFNVPASKRSISIMGDGGFWHNGLASSIGNAAPASAAFVAFGACGF